MQFLQRAQLPALLMFSGLVWAAFAAAAAPSGNESGAGALGLIAKPAALVVPKEDHLTPTGLTALVPFVHKNTTYKLWTRRIGSGRLKILLINGAGGGGHIQWDGVLARPEFDDGELILWDQLGQYGSSCFSGDDPCTWDTSWMGLDTFVEQARAVQLHLELPPEDTLVVGHSFGVVVAIDFALKYPSGFRAMVLSDWVACEAQHTRRMHYLYSLRGNFMRSMVQTYPCPASLQWMFGIKNPGPYGKHMWGPDGDGVGGELEKWDRRDRLKEIRQPVLVFAGGHDIIFPKDAEDMAAALEHGTYHFLPDAAHFSYIDDPDGWFGTYATWKATWWPSAAGGADGGAAREALAGKAPAALAGGGGVFVLLWLLLGILAAVSIAVAMWSGNRSVVVDSDKLYIRM